MERLRVKRSGGQGYGRRRIGLPECGFQGLCLVISSESYGANRKRGRQTEDQFLWQQGAQRNEKSTEATAYISYCDFFR